MEYNRLLAKEKILKEKLAKDKETTLNTWEIAQNYQDPVLAEDPNQAASALGSHRIRRDHYKGMSNEDAAVVYESNRLQQDELRAKREAEKEDDRKWAANDQALNSLVLDQDNRYEQGKLEERFANVNVLKYQQKEHTKRKIAAKSDASFAATDAFYEGFGKCS